MRRVWFKREMMNAILNGKKTSTTRDHEIPLGRIKAVSGSRFTATEFALLEITSCMPMTVKRVITEFYKEEGFESPEEMRVYGNKNRLLLGLQDRPVYYHTFKVIRRFTYGP